ncbi:MAG: hypothetical protein BGO09_04120 [Bacteroidetes bacterium 47-18]|nr:MAG: hypothetical protein BGO09_04120 [Bacteroidetes bacterium 47-18]
MKIGLVGENPSDTNCIEVLLKKEFGDTFSYVHLVKNINGSNLEEQKTKHILRKEYANHKPDLVIFVRDLDSLRDNKKQWNMRKAYFTDFNSVVDRLGVPFIIIYELEAIILSDISAFNQKYGTQLIINKAPDLYLEPKEVLMKAYKYYDTGDNIDLFNNLDVNIVKRNYKYYDLLVRRIKQKTGQI